MQFIVIDRNVATPSTGQNTAYLKIDYWNDFSFVTMFYLTLFDERGRKHDLGNIKIGFKGQTEEISTHSQIGGQFNYLPEGYFSLADDIDFYKEVYEELTSSCRDDLLDSLQDVVQKQELIDDVVEEAVFGTSLLRSTSLASVKGQYVRILSGLAELTDYNFTFSRSITESLAELELHFQVNPNSIPPTNIHAVIGRNGVGKTTLLNGMISSVIQGDIEKGQFLESRTLGPGRAIRNDYFSSLVSVSFSVFDPFDPPEERADPSRGTCYYYVGLKKTSGDVGESELKTLDELRGEFVDSVKLCFKNPFKKKRWLNAINVLESDPNFRDMDLEVLDRAAPEYFQQSAEHLISKMSSGHAIVIITITKLVEKVEEKTLVIIDEPESHLHPPLLSAFTRALSNLLYDRNGVAIIATHSPVILQEVPRNCVWKITRRREEMLPYRPEQETFAENVGILTREVFGLEVATSGFHQMLQSSVDEGLEYEQILLKYRNKIGFEGRAILRAMLLAKESSL